MRHEVCSVVVGVLSDLAVDNGDQVDDGQQVCCVESMKTMFPLYAPSAGRVCFVLDLGQIAGEGEVVFEVDDGIA